MKKQKVKILLSIIITTIVIISLSVGQGYAKTNQKSEKYVYIYKSKSSIYGGSKGNTVSIPIPSGYKYNVSETGYVSIQDEDNANLKYIWVPLNDFSLKQELWEEVYEKYNKEEGINISTESEIFKILKNSGETLSQEFINSIKEYKGFYISEAELSYDGNNKPYNKARGMVDNSVTGTDEKGDYYRGSTTSNLTYSKMKSIAESVTKENTAVKSHLMYGIEWDAMILWIANTNASYKDKKGNSISKVLVGDSTNVGKYLNSGLGATASASDTEFFNGIWGLGGNLAEVTQETYNGKYVTRGGAYNTTGENTPIASRNVTSNIVADNIGFRTALYVTPGLESKTIEPVKITDNDNEEENDKQDVDSGINNQIDDNNSSQNNKTDEKKNTEEKELDEIEYTDIFEEKAGSNDYNHTSTGMAYVKFYETNYIWYYQSRGPWAADTYWGGTIASDGCGPTSVSTIASPIQGQHLNPSHCVAYYLYKKGFKPGDYTGTPSTWTYRTKLEAVLHDALVKTYEITGNDLNTTHLKDHIKSANGRSAMIAVGAGAYTKKGHVMALIGANNNSFYIANPNPKTPGGWCSISSVSSCLAWAVQCWI